MAVFEPLRLGPVGGVGESLIARSSRATRLVLVPPRYVVAVLIVVSVVVALLAAQIGAVRTASGAEIAEDGTSDEASGRLNQLLTDYREYGLPLPPREAVLVRRRHGGSYVNGEQQFRYDMAWQEERSGKAVYWLGTSTETGRATIEKLGPDPVAEVLDGRDNSVVVSRRIANNWRLWRGTTGRTSLRFAPSIAGRRSRG